MFKTAAEGTGTHIARKFVVLAVALPTLFSAVGAYLTTLDVLDPLIAFAFSAAFAAASLLILSLRMARRIDALESRLQRQSVIDGLTGLYNLRGMQLLGDQALREARRLKVGFSVLYFDLDGLKRANDQFGHHVGSQFLIDVAELLREHFQESDIVARIGGDEFAVITMGSHLQVKTALCNLAQDSALRSTSLKRPYEIGYSVGEALDSGARNESLMQIVERADAAMYRDKQKKFGASVSPDIC